MKRILCSFVLLFAMSTAGLLVGSKSASTQDVSRASNAPTMLADLRQELNYSAWEGTWEEHEYFNSGPAKLFLTMEGENTVHAQFRMFETGDGNKMFWTSGTIRGNTMELTGGNGKFVFSLSKENGALVLRGDYKVIAGQYVGETGTYYFKKKE